MKQANLKELKPELREQCWLTRTIGHQLPRANQEKKSGVKQKH